MRACKHSAASTEPRAPRLPVFPVMMSDPFASHGGRTCLYSSSKEEKNRLWKHSGQMSTQRRTSSKETHIKRNSESVNRQLALSESAKNKQTFEFTNRGISSALTLVRLQWRIQRFLPCGTFKWSVASSQRCGISSDMYCRALQHLSLETAPQNARNGAAANSSGSPPGSPA